MKIRRNALAVVIAALGIFLLTASYSTSTSSAGNVCDLDEPRSEAVSLLCAGIARQDQGDFDGAIPDFERALELQPDLVEAHMMLGISYYEQGNYPLALAEYDQYLAVIADNYHAWSNRGAAHLKNGDLVAARADIERALALNPNDVQLLENRIVIARESDDLETLIRDCTWLLEHFPPEATWLMERGKAFGAESRFGESLADLGQAVELNPTADSYYFRGITWYFTGQHEAAAADFSRSLELDPDRALSYLWRCKLRYQQQQFAAALPDCDEYVRREPLDQAGYYTRAIIRSRAGDQDLALADYRRAIELARTPGELANAWYGVGVTSERAGRKPEARAAYRQTLEIDPDYELARKALKRVNK